MAWLRSEQSLLHHPKTVHLKSLLGVETATVIGRLHMLWWWCLDYAYDGDLSKKETKVIEDACQVPLKMLIRAGFVDSRPYRRIHSWYEIQGNYLRVRFKDQPEKWQRIKHMYENDLPISKHRLNGEGNNPRSSKDVDRGRTDVEYGRTDVDVKEKVGSLPALVAGVPLPEEKRYEDAKDDELCGPPKDLFKELKDSLKARKI